jgi:predicted ATPase
MLDVLLAETDDQSLIKRRESIESEIKIIKSQLGEKQRLFLIYKQQLAQWEKSKSELQGDKGKRDTILWYMAEIAALDNLPTQREKLKTERIEIVRRLHEQLQKVVAEYRALYEPVQRFVQSTARMDMPLPLDFNVRIAEEGFQENFLGRINRQIRGSFFGIDESNILVRGLLKETDLMDVESVVMFVKKIDDMLHFYRRSGGEVQTELSVVDQLRKGNQLNELYDLLFGLEYLKPQYSLTYGGLEINKLSPGERGLLLLVFYLLVDKDDIPLVIDQPEENLDNQTIYKILVTCIKTAKQRRQIIMVTHNPNLAVVCDAEQIIYASCDKSEKKFTYLTGAIESPEIKECVIEILEGTEPAFVNRKVKYGL